MSETLKNKCEQSVNFPEQQSGLAKPNTKFKADKNKLDRECARIGKNLEDIAVAIGHHKRWFSQRFQVAKKAKTFPIFTMDDSDAMEISRVLHCGVYAFAAEEEVAWEPIVFRDDLEVGAYLKSCPPEQKDIVISFTRYMQQATPSDLVRLQDFFKQQPKDADTTPNPKNQNWLYAYVMKQTLTRVKEALKSYLQVPDDNTLQEKVMSTHAATQKKHASICSLGLYDPSKDSSEQLRKYLKSDAGIGESYWNALLNAQDRVIEDCVLALKRYYIVKDSEMVNYVASVKDSVKKSDQESTKDSGEK